LHVAADLLLTQPSFPPRALLLSGLREEVIEGMYALILEFEVGVQTILEFEVFRPYLNSR
jgi:hypothetical protein